MQELLYSILWENKKNFYKEKNKWYIITKTPPFNNFLKLNIMFDTERIWKQIWITNLGHLFVLLKTLDLKTNEVSYSILDLSSDRKRKIKTLFKKEWLVRKIKLSSEKETKYYFNPTILFYWKGVNDELQEKFNTIN